MKSFIFIGGEKEQLSKLKCNLYDMISDRRQDIIHYVKQPLKAI